MRVTWLSNSSASRSCLVCGLPALREIAVLDTTHLRAQPLSRCESCGAAVLNDLEPRSFAETTEAAVREGAEMAIGLEGALDPLFKLDLNGFRSFLDVGCGYGWVLDYVHSSYGWRGTGIDSGAQAAAGRRWLGVHVVEADLTRGAELVGAPFDLVYACEVIEHVVDAPGFVAGVRGVLTAGRPFLLRTPNAAVLGPNTDDETVRTVLSPGYHVILYTARSLELVLRQAGFRHVRVAAIGATLMAAAADAPFHWQPDARVDAENLIGYLRRRRRELPARSEFWTGLTYVLLKRLAFAGRYDEAEEIWSELAEQLTGIHGIDSTDTSRLEDVKGSVDGNVLPQVLCGVLMIRGLLELNHRVDRTSAAAYFRAAAATGRAVEARLELKGVFGSEVTNFRQFSERHAIVTTSNDDLPLARALWERLRATAAQPDLEAAQLYLIAQRTGINALADELVHEARRGPPPSRMRIEMRSTDRWSVA